MTESYDSDDTYCSEVNMKNSQNIKCSTSQASKGRTFLSQVHTRILSHLKKEEFLERTTVTIFLKELRDFKPYNADDKSAIKKMIDQLICINTDIAKYERILNTSGDNSLFKCNSSSFLDLTQSPERQESNKENHAIDSKQDKQTMNAPKDNSFVKRKSTSFVDLSQDSLKSHEILESNKNNHIKKWKNCMPESVSFINLNEVKQILNTPMENIYKCKSTCADLTQHSTSLKSPEIQKNLAKNPTNCTPESITLIDSTKPIESLKSPEMQVSNEGNLLREEESFMSECKTMSIVFDDFESIRQQIEKSKNKTLSELFPSANDIVKEGKPDDYSQWQLNKFKSQPKNILEEININKPDLSTVNFYDSYNREKTKSCRSEGQKIQTANVLVSNSNGYMSNQEKLTRDENAKFQKDLLVVLQAAEAFRMNVITKLDAQAQSNIKVVKVCKNKVNPFYYDDMEVKEHESQEDDNM